jgi:hypothetical protein
MTETIELRIYKKYAHLLLQPYEGTEMGQFVSVHIPVGDTKLQKVAELTKQIQEEHNDFFFLYSSIKREYSKHELDTAALLQMVIKTTFEPAGEECGTLYDETTSCDICGANRKQIGPLWLKRSSIPKKDIARTIAGEVVMSDRFAEALTETKLKGVSLEPIQFQKRSSETYYQLVASAEVELSKDTVAGVNYFDHSETSDGEIYKCAKGHTIGLNLLSEVYVEKNEIIHQNDFMASRQKIGVKRGLLRPEPIYLCSQAFRNVVQAENITGLTFEVAHIV